MDKTKLAIEIFDAFAVQYQDKFMSLDLYHDSFDLFCQSVIKQNATVLELACGPGNITKYLLQKRLDFNILGTDLSPAMLALAKANNPLANFQLMDCRAIDQLEDKYDGIVCGFGLPYLSREEAIKFIQDAATVLNPEGVLYLSTMEDDYHKSGFKTPSNGKGPQLYIHYHQADYLTQALHESGFSIVDLSRQKYPETDGSETTDLIILAKKQRIEAEKDRPLPQS